MSCRVSIACIPREGPPRAFRVSSRTADAIGRRRWRAGSLGRVVDFLRYSDRIGRCRPSGVESHVVDYLADLVFRDPVVQCSTDMPAQLVGPIQSDQRGYGYETPVSL